MNEIKLKVNFGKRTIVKSGISLTTGDYNSTKIKFEFDREDGRKFFEMMNPNNEVIFVDEIVNNEVILVGQTDVTTKHNEVNYTKYTDNNDTVYWYDSESEKLYNTEFVEVQNVSLDDLIKVTENASLFTMPGRYTFEISLYDGDSKLTSKSDVLDVKEEQVVINDNMVSLYLPVFDRLIEELDNLDIDVSKSGSTTTVVLTKKDGTTKSVNILDGDKGDKGDNGADGLDAKINGVNTLIIEAGTNITLDQEGSVLTINSTASGGSSDYEELANLPQINGVELTGNKSLNDLGIQPEGDYALESDIPDVSNFITKTVNDLAYYYKKSETFTKQEVNNLISAITTMDIQVVQTLPVQDISTTTIYLVPKTTAETNDAYDEFIYVSNNWEHIGSTDIDLSGYQTKIDSSHKLSSDLVDDTNQSNLFVTSSEKSTWNNKVDASELTDYIQKTDYATTSKAGLVKTSNDYAIQVSGTSGLVFSQTKTFSQYNNASNIMFISKGTLENVITGKNLVSSSALSTVATSGSYNDLSNKPTIQDCFIVSITVNGGVLTASHSPSEIKAAVDSGKYAYLKDPLDGIYQIVFVDSTEVIATQIIGHGTNYNASYIKIAIDSQKNITVTESDLLTSHQDISGKLNTSAVKTSTNTTQGNVYDVTYINSMLGNIEALLGGI